MHLEFGVPTDKSAAEVRLGIEKGFFRDEGIDLSVRIVFGGPPLAAAYNRGELMFGEIGSPPAINAIAAGARFRIIGSGTRRKAHMYLGVRPEIRSFAELKGKRIGLLSIGSCPDWFLRRILVVEGLDPAHDVTFVPLLEDYPRVIDLIKEGRIDACLATEPAISEGEAKGLISVWRRSTTRATFPTSSGWLWLRIPTSLPGIPRSSRQRCARCVNRTTMHWRMWTSLPT
jgi:ABC-type nitrate/sulfonate/bicarbonate transport system substrate-binding protein